MDVVVGVVRGGCAHLPDARPVQVPTTGEWPPLVAGPARARLRLVDAHQVIVTKRDTRRYLPDPVAEVDLEALVGAARMAGSAKNGQVTRLVVVTDEEGRRCLAAAGDFTGWIDVAPVVVVLVAPSEGIRLFDLGRMAQNLMLEAHARGLATCPVTFQHQDPVRAALGVPADHEGPMGVTVGHPGPPDASHEAAPRIPVGELVHRERWQG